MLAPKTFERSTAIVSRALVVLNRAEFPRIPGIRRKIRLETPSEEANRRFNKLILSSVIGLTPTEVGNVLRINTGSGRFKHNLEIAFKIKAHPRGKRFLTPNFYTLLLLLLAKGRDRALVPLALQLFRETAETQYTSEELELALNSLFECFKNCQDFTQLFTLKIVYQSIIARRGPSLNAEMKYRACHMHVLLNSSQVSLAMVHFQQCLHQLHSDTEKASLLKLLPIHKLLNALCLAQDCNSILVVLEELISSDCSDIVSFPDWSEILGTLLWKNDYKLVKLIYTHVIMHGIDPLVLEDSVLEIGLTKINLFLGSLCESTLLQILHTLATNGDVSLCLNLIEWHFIHKSMLGEKALTKDLCVEVIRAYCYHHPESTEIATRTDEDNSVKSLLDVIESFVSRNRHVFTYKDVVDAFLHKLNIYHEFDEKVAQALFKETGLHFNLADLEAEDDIVVKKRSNTNIRESAQGSVLKNTEILLTFIVDHLTYISLKQYSRDTCQIFVNCLLCHLAVYQNTTGVVSALQAMKSVDDSFLEKWLDVDLYDIVIQSFSESPAAMAAGLFFYTHMKHTLKHVSEKNFKSLVFSSLRGNKYNALLELYAYEYLRLGPDCVSPHLLRRIRSFKKLNEKGKELLQCLENYRPEHFHRLDEIWDTHNFTKVDPHILQHDEEYTIFRKIDAKDQAILEKILR